MSTVVLEEGGEGKRAKGREEKGGGGWGEGELEEKGRASI
jgi:hypothetical protein